MKKDLVYDWLNLREFEKDHFQIKLDDLSQWSMTPYWIETQMNERLRMFDFREH